MPRGRPRNSPNKANVFATPAEMHALEVATRSQTKARLLKDILAEYANFCAGVANHFAPRAGSDGRPVIIPADEDIFLRYMDRACMFADRGAKYQSPTFKAITVMTDLTADRVIEAEKSNVALLEDAHGAMRVYRQLIAKVA